MVDMVLHRQQVEAAVAFLRDRVKEPPEVLIQLGTGLGELTRAMQVDCTLAYEDIPHFPRSTVVSHAGNLAIGRLGGKRVAILQGRVHFYEGYSARETAFPIRVLALLGAKTAIITNASGGLNPAYRPGTLMVFADHINLLGDNPLRGPNFNEIGERFPDMSQPYDRSLRDLARQVAQEENIALQEGVYVSLSGPSFESPADLRFLRTIGADAVGMSTVPEVIVARHGKMRVLGVSGISNKANLDGSTVTTHEEVLEAGKVIVPKLQAILLGVLARL